MPDVEKKVGLCSIAEARKFLSISQSSIYKRILAGDIPTRRFGRSHRIPWAWLYAQAEIPERYQESN